MCSQYKYYPSVFSLALLFNIQCLTSFPLEPPNLPYAPQQPVSVNVSDVPIASRNLNVSDNNPNLRTGLESPLSVNANVSSRSGLPTVNVNPVPLPLPIPEVSVRSGLNPEVPPPLVGVPGVVNQQQPVERANFGVKEPVANVSVVDAPVARVGLGGLTSNSSDVEQRSLNVPNSPVVANVSSVDVRSGLNADVPPVGVVNSSGNNYGSGGGFVPSFFKTFGLREKRGEIVEGSAPVADLSLRSGMEQPVKEDGSVVAPDLAVRSNVEQAAPSNSNLDVIAPPQLASSLEGASKDANLYSGSNVKSPVNPYINVFPLGSFGY